MSEQIQPRRTFTRRGFLGLGAGVAAFAAVGCGNGPEKPTLPLQPITQPTPTIGEMPKTPGVQLSAVERMLWSETPFISITPEKTAAEIDAQFREQMSGVLNKMRKSENPEFQKASTTLVTMNAEKKIFLTPILGDMSSIMSVDPVYDSQEGKTAYVLKIYLSNLTKVDDVRVALALAHEADHLREMERIAQEARTMNIPENEIYKNVAEKMRAQCVAEESRAYAHETKAYQSQKLLTGYSDPEQDFRLKLFAESGYDASNKKWQEIVNSQVDTCKR